MHRNQINRKIYKILDKIIVSLDYQIQEECTLLADVQSLKHLFCSLNKEDVNNHLK